MEKFIKDFYKDYKYAYNTQFFFNVQGTCFLIFINAYFNKNFTIYIS